MNKAPNCIRENVGLNPTGGYIWLNLNLLLTVNGKPLDPILEPSINKSRAL